MVSCETSRLQQGLSRIRCGDEDIDVGVCGGDVVVVVGVVCFVSLFVVIADIIG